MSQPTPLSIDGSEYFSAAQIVEATGISRQTLWRWRQEGKVPAGHRFRDKLLVFTAGELDLIRQYANRLEPISDTRHDQLNLFTGDR
jgi:hypothetical protein